MNRTCVRLASASTGTTTICISMEILFAAAVSGNTTTCISIRKSYFLHQHGNICVSNKRKNYYYRHHRTAETTTTCCSIENVWFFRFFLKRLVDGKPNFSFPLVFQVTLLILLLLMHLSPPTYIHISPIHILHIHIYHIVLLVCIIAAWLNWILACLQCGSCLDQRPAPAPVLDLTGLD